MGSELQKVTRVVQFTFRVGAEDSRFRFCETPETRIVRAQSKLVFVNKGVVVIINLL